MRNHYPMWETEYPTHSSFIARDVDINYIQLLMLENSQANRDISQYHRARRDLKELLVDQWQEQDLKSLLQTPALWPCFFTVTGQLLCRRAQLACLDPQLWKCLSSSRKKGMPETFPHIFRDSAIMYKDTSTGSSQPITQTYHFTTDGGPLTRKSTKSHKGKLAPLPKMTWCFSSFGGRQHPQCYTFQYVRHITRFKAFFFLIHYSLLPSGNWILNSGFTFSLTLTMTQNCVQHLGSAT